MIMSLTRAIYCPLGAGDKGWLGQYIVQRERLTSICVSV